ncbi:conserved uncharacterized protein [Ustilago hordei]|uniref:Conserved uncharacterized protein n=1 Tax=Ustilago hordei TaxID=120017 RepID=I2FSA7_USTHO|nr:conserved uncharacterized protein [Ustilago hordei]
MKLSGMFRIGFVAAIVTALILLPSCITAVGDEASTSTRPQYRLKEYQKNLNVETINSLNDLSRFPQGTHDIYEKVPFYHGKLFLDHSSHDEQSQVRAPLYSIDTPIGTVQQAIKDFKFVGIVDVSNNNARLFQLVVDKSGNRIEQIEFPDRQKVVRLFELDPILHHVRNFLLRKTSNTYHISMESPSSAKTLKISANCSLPPGIPPHEVYYFENEKLPIVFKPNTDEMFEEVKEQELYMARGHYLAAKQKYGQEIASIIWGKPIQLNDNSNDRLKSRIPLRDYPRFKSDAPDK